MRRANLIASHGTANGATAYSLSCPRFSPSCTLPSAFLGSSAAKMTLRKA